MLLVPSFANTVAICLWSVFVFGNELGTYGSIDGQVHLSHGIYGVEAYHWGIYPWVKYRFALAATDAIVL